MGEEVRIMNEIGTLHLIATPIGNLGDMSFRAIETLQKVDLIAAEDTRQTLKLLNHFEIKNKLVSYYEHNKVQKGNMLIEQLKSGKSIALVSDAGTPGISDPGEDLVALAHANHIPVTMVPGPAAMIMAVVVSGMASGRFVFEGFLPMNKRARKERLENLLEEERTKIFYEAPHKLRYTLQDMLECWGNCKIVLCREMTKKFEEIIRTDIEKALQIYEKESPKGEFVIVVEGFEKMKESKQYSPEEIVMMVQSLISVGKHKMDAVKEIAKQVGLHKREVYQLLLEKETQVK